MATEVRNGGRNSTRARGGRENFAWRKKSEIRTLVVDDAHILEAGNGAHELEKFGRISTLYV
jgi:hypothetical protein